MVPRIKDMLRWIDSWAPFRYAESWDNCGLQVGNPEAAAEKVLVALDPGVGVLGEARALGCGCIVTHHPLMLRPILAVRADSWPGSFIVEAIKAEIALIAAHTNLDSAIEGTNAQLGKLLGIDVEGSIEAERSFAGERQYAGMGLIGALPAAVRLAALASGLKNSLGGAPVRLTGDPDREVRRVAVCSGSGGSLIGRVLALGADVYVTGDMKYHDGRLAEESGLAVIDIGHFASEKLILEPLAGFLRSQARLEGAGLEVFVSRREQDPFRVVDGNCSHV